MNIADPNDVIFKQGVRQPDRQAAPICAPSPSPSLGTDASDSNAKDSGADANDAPASAPAPARTPAQRGRQEDGHRKTTKLSKEQLQQRAAAGAVGRVVAQAGRSQKSAVALPATGNIECPGQHGRAGFHAGHYLNLRNKWKAVIVSEVICVCGWTLMHRRGRPMTMVSSTLTLTSLSRSRIPRSWGRFTSWSVEYLMTVL